MPCYVILFSALKNKSYDLLMSRILSVVGQRKLLKVTNNAIQRALGCSFSQTLCKDNHFGGGMFLDDVYRVE